MGATVDALELALAAGALAPDINELIGGGTQQLEVAACCLVS